MATIGVVGSFVDDADGGIWIIETSIIANDIGCGEVGRIDASVSALDRGTESEGNGATCFATVDLLVKMYNVFGVAYQVGEIVAVTRNGDGPLSVVQHKVGAAPVPC